MKEVNFSVLQFNYALFSSVCTGAILIGLCIASTSAPFSFDSWIVYGELFLAGFVNFCAQSLHVIANQKTNPATVALISYVGVAYMFLSDLLFFELNLTLMQLSGVMICLTCSVSVVIYKMNLPKSEEASYQKPLLSEASQQFTEENYDNEFKTLKTRP